MVERRRGAFDEKATILEEHDYNPLSHAMLRAPGG
jgi:hypothetical protein